MKKIILSLLALATCGLATAQTLSVADVYVTPGGKASFGLSVNVGTGEYDAYQFTMNFPATGFSLTGQKTSTDLWDGSLSLGTLVSGVANASGISNDGTAIPSGDILLGTVEFEAESTLATGEYDVTISNFEFINKGTGTSIADVTFKVYVTDMLTLDENSTTLPSDQDGVDVLVKRTIQKNVWSTLCLPFDMTEAQVKSVFGNGVKVAEFVDFAVEGDAFTVNFEATDLTADGFSANYPYIIMSENELTEFSVSGVTIQADEENAVCEYTNGKTGNKKKTYGTFQGTLKAGTTIPENDLFLANNKFYYSTGSTLIQGFRGYFWLQNFDPSSMAPVFNINGKATNIEGLQIVDGDGRIYNLNGQHVENPTSKGVYIQNGKKIVMKK